MSRPLSGVKVVELATFVAGPVTGRLLADLGAEVIKVERPDGDAWRVTGVSYRPERFTDDENPVFDIYNAGKKHVSLNLKSEAGMEAFHRLLADADVFVTNTRPNALKRLGLSYDDLKERYPGLIFAILLGYGEEGPYARMPAFDTSAFWAKSGFLLDLAADGEGYSPVQPPFSMGDTVTGYMLMGEICAALYRKKETGLGDCVRAGLYHNSIFTMGTMAIISQPPFGQVFPKIRAMHSAPGGDYCCADGKWIYMSGYADRNAVVHTMLGLEWMTEDPRFATPADRARNRQAYYECVRDAFLSQTSDYWIKKAKEYDLPLVRMGHFSEISQDEQAWANDYLEEVTFRSGNVDVMPRSPIEMESVGKLETVPAPAIGADTETVLKRLGYTEAELAEMSRSGAIRVV